MRQENKSITIPSLKRKIKTNSINTLPPLKKQKVSPYSPKQKISESEKFNHKIQCSVRHEAWPIKTKIKDDSKYECARCKRDTTIPKKSVIKQHDSMFLLSYQILLV